jgi:ketosteroid isomerase-like protein
MDGRDAARRWRVTWERAWRDHDPAAIVALYADDALFQSHPFRSPQAPADYIVPTLAAEESTACEFDEPLVDGDLAAVAWRAETQLKDGGREELAGVSLLRFDGEGLVVEQRDFWGQAPRDELAARPRPGFSAEAGQIRHPHG